jgi:phosphoribosylglycinamide formyltransferase 1
MSMRMVFCVSGGGALFKAAVRERGTIPIEPVLLIARPAAAPDLEDFCAQNDVEMVRLPKMDRPAFDARITELCVNAKPDLISLTFDRLLPQAFVETFSHRLINMHPSLLPAFAGIDGVRDAMASGTRYSGATIQEVVHEMDAGPIVAQCVVPIVPGEPRESWGARMYRLCEPMYLQVLAWYAEGRVAHSEAGHVLVRDANYDALPISPALERFQVT